MVFCVFPTGCPCGSSLPSLLHVLVGFKVLDELGIQ